jgi:hypothetical protein
MRAHVPALGALLFFSGACAPPYTRPAPEPAPPKGSAEVCVLRPESFAADVTMEMPFTDDGSPYVGESSEVPGYHVCLATTGFTLMPLLARMLAEHMATGAPLPPSFSPDRRSSDPAPTT